MSSEFEATRSAKVWATSRADSAALHQCRHPVARRARAITADPRLDPDTTVWASTDAGFGDIAPLNPEPFQVDPDRVLTVPSFDVCHPAPVLGYSREHGLGLVEVDGIEAEGVDQNVFASG